jgi:hypothetical protein
MAHWAEIDENNIVLRVTVGDNDDPEGDEGYKWLLDNLGGTWIKTSYNGNIRKNFAGIGYTYDKNKDVFYSEQPFASWSLNEDTYIWEAPTPMPEDNKMYKWNEEILDWEEVV